MKKSLSTMDANELNNQSTQLETKMKELRDAIEVLKDMESVMQEMSVNVDYHLRPAWMNDQDSAPYSLSNPSSMDPNTVVNLPSPPPLRRNNRIQSLPKPSIRTMHDLENNPPPCTEQDFESICVGDIMPINGRQHYTMASANIATEINSAHPSDSDTLDSEEHIECDPDDVDDHNTDHVVPLHKADIPKKYTDMVDNLIGPDTTNEYTA